MKLVGRVPLSRFDREPIVRLRYPPFDVVVVRTADGVYALEDACNHAGASLALGWVRDECLICPVHQYAFDLETGSLIRPRGLCSPQRTFRVLVEADCAVVYDPFHLVVIGPADP